MNSSNSNVVPICLCPHCNENLKCTHINHLKIRKIFLYIFTCFYDQVLVGSICDKYFIK